MQKVIFRGERETYIANGKRILLVDGRHIKRVCRPNASERLMHRLRLNESSARVKYFFTPLDISDVMC
ncbi:hypothetical protein X777_11774 [Ooceraea biroi]|uniref:Uncharacterized protein n=1 Tax=Ooceraea biroi TaxID=2015173 RepID=A0A026W101_OOCBI|nr:hypothetical protein X777_11774 [Ooceraea biroi]